MILNGKSLEKWGGSPTSHIRLAFFSGDKMIVSTFGTFMGTNPSGK
jgi:hypothetical protein